MHLLKLSLILIFYAANGFVYSSGSVLTPGDEVDLTCGAASASSTTRTFVTAPMRDGLNLVMERVTEENYVNWLRYADVQAQAHYVKSAYEQRNSSILGNPIGEALGYILPGNEFFRTVNIRKFIDFIKGYGEAREFGDVDVTVLNNEFYEQYIVPIIDESKGIFSPDDFLEWKDNILGMKIEDLVGVFCKKCPASAGAIRGKLEEYEKNITIIRKLTFMQNATPYFRDALRTYYGDYKQEVYVAYITRGAPQPIPDMSGYSYDPSFSFKDHSFAKDIKMFVTVTTTSDSQITHHMGISESVESVLSPETRLKGVSVDLHSFAAKVMRELTPGKLYLITWPLPIMAKIPEKALASCENGIMFLDQFFKTHPELGKDTGYNLILKEGIGVVMGEVSTKVAIDLNALAGIRVCSDLTFR